MTTSRRALLVVNTHSRRGREAAAAAAEQLGARGFTVVDRDCGSAEGLSRLIVEEGRAVDLVVIGGGDGTLNAAAPGVIETAKPLGILPTGTANDLARTLGIPDDLDEAAAVIAAGRTRRIDLGEVNGHPFFNVASIGLSARLAQTLTRDVKRRFGRLGYALAAVRVLAHARPFRARIISPEGKVRVLTLQIAIGNGRFYGGGMTVEKDAAIDDRHLDLYSLEMRRAWKLALMARSFRYGEHGAWEEVRAIRSTSFEIATRHPQPVNADGEIVTTTPARFALRPAAIEVFAPPPPAR